MPNQDKGQLIRIDPTLTQHRLLAYVLSYTQSMELHCDLLF